MAVSKAEEVHTKTEALIAAGTTKADAFKQLAREYSQPVNSIRGSYYSFTSAKNSGGTPRPRRRETTLEAAVADARAALERSLAAIDREVEAAVERAKEATAEHEALQASAGERKAAIAERLEALK
jgi:hypothetical protein